MAKGKITKFKYFVTAFLMVFFAIFLVACKNELKAVGIEVTPPTKTTYYVGEQLDTAGLIVKIKFEDESSEVISDYELSGFDSSKVGSLTINVSYLEFSGSFTVEIIEENRDEVTSTTLVTYDVPKPYETSENFKVKVEDEELFVYETLINNRRVFSWAAPTTTVPVAMFDFEGRVKVSIEVVGEEVVNPIVRPLSSGVTAEVVNGKIEFTLSYPENYTIEYEVVGKPVEGSDSANALHLFANHLEQNPITAEDAEGNDDIIYIGPGVYKTDTLPLRSNQTVYIAGGAVLYGQFNVYNLENITIRGRGVINGSIYPRTAASERAIPFEFYGSKNITIEGIAILDPAGWALHIQNSTDVLVDNIKIVSARPNGDGVSVQSSKDVVVKDSFIRTWDDSLVVKNMGNKPTENILLKNNILWTDLAQSMEVGYETYGEYMRDIIFENITVLHNYHKPAMSIHNADQADVSNVIFRNITIEDAQMIGDNAVSTDDDFIIDLDIRFNPEWSKSQDVRGTISNVTFNNILVVNAKDELKTRVYGNSATKGVNGVLFNNITINDKNVENAEDLNLITNDFVRGIEIASTQKATGAQFHKKYILALDNEDVAVANNPSVDKPFIEIPQFMLKETTSPYVGVEITGDYQARATKGKSRLEWGEEQTEEFSSEDSSVETIFTKDDTMWYSKPFEYTQGEFAAVTIELGEKQAIGTIRIHGDHDSIWYIKQSIAVFGRSKRDDGTYTNFVSKKNALDYEFSNATGNYVDIKLVPEQLDTLQLRFYSKVGMEYSTNAFINYVEFYPASLTYNKSVYYSEHEDVYPGQNLVDGNLLTYFESKKGVFPSFFAVDIGSIQPARFINLHLPPLSSWPPRTQTIEIQISTDAYGSAATFTTIVPATEYLFDVASGNMVTITLPEATEMRVIKLIFTSNSSQSGEAAQLSEISVY